jgi:hypothetical protein
VHLRIAGVAIIGVLAGATTARAEDRLIDADTFAVGERGDLIVDAGLLVARPAALPAGISTGVAAGITRMCGCRLAWGARAAWSEASGSSQVWTVTHQDLRLRATGLVRYDAGRGMLALRLGAGTTVVYEDRVRNQGMRAGLTGSELETTALSALPAAELDAVVGLHVAGPWLLVVSAGPTVDYHDGGLHGGWAATLGAGWQP